MTEINGQPSLFLLDSEGKEYPAIAEVNRKKRVNGQRELSLSFLYDQINQDFIHDIEFGWKILFKGEWYTITSPSYALDGDRFSVGVDAVLSFFVDMNGHYLQDEVQDKSMTPANFFRELFEGTGYSYVLVDNLSANTLNYQANQSKTERFLYGIDRFNAEYVIRGKVAYIHGLVGSDKNVILHEDLNIQDISIDVDGSGFHTWAKGFGDKDENEEDADYKLETDEHVPGLVEKYGWIEGPAIRDGSYKHETNLKEAIKKQIENSVKISTAITAVDLSNNGYPEMQFEEGDRIWLYVIDLKQNQQVRVVEIDETFDWEGKIISAQYTLGNEGIAARYKTQQYSTLKDFRDIASGRKVLEFNWLPEAIKRASDIINGNIDSHFKYGAGEIIGINRSNPNGYMRFNTDGLGFSRDGGSTYRTAITYEGIVADAITTGTLRSIIIEAVEIYGSKFFSRNGDSYLEIEGGNIHLEQAAGNYMRISPDGLRGFNRDDTVRFRVDATLVTTSAFGTSISNAYIAPMPGGEARVVNYNDIPGDGIVTSYRYLPLRASGFYGNYVNVNPAVAGGSSNLYLRTLSNGEVRITLNETTSNYQDIRADWGYFNRIIPNALQSSQSHFYIGTIDNGEVRVVNNESTDNFRAVRASGYYGSFIDTPDTNLYGRTASGGEFRITLRGGTSNYQNLRADWLYGNRLIVNALQGENNHFYAGTINDGEFRVVNGSSSDVYRSIRAQRYLLPDGSNAFTAGTFSSLSLHPNEGEGINLINNIDLLRYTNGGKPVYKINGDDVAVDDVVATLVKSVQEINTEINQLKGA
ncbi:phage tail protein [Oceanobacillus sp. FSL W8-0428]|uniref:phage tail protein n=1 Tax=Oceanobacillus sp. FSL W8-0428 TaxID=2921715 RepID=UPI0030FB1C6F